MKPRKHRHDRNLFVPQEDRLLGIHFGDNDFSRVIRRFLALFIDSDWDSDRFSLISKEYVVQQFNATIAGIYSILCQETDPNAMEHCQKYLQITAKDVFIGRDCLEAIMDPKSVQYYDHTFHYVDLHQKMVFSM